MATYCLKLLKFCNSECPRSVQEFAVEFIHEKAFWDRGSGFVGL